MTPVEPYFNKIKYLTADISKIPECEYGCQLAFKNPTHLIYEHYWQTELLCMTW